MEQITLPQTAQVIAEVIGTERTLALARVCKWRSVYIPETLPAGHWLRTIVGDDEAEKLSKEFPGFTLPLAKCSSAMKAQRNARIAAMYRGGMTQGAIAEEMNMSEHTVQTILYRMGIRRGARVSCAKRNIPQ